MGNFRSILDSRVNLFLLRVKTIDLQIPFEMSKTFTIFLFIIFVMLDIRFALNIRVKLFPL